MLEKQTKLERDLLLRDFDCLKYILNHSFEINIYKHRSIFNKKDIRTYTVGKTILPHAAHNFSDAAFPLFFTILHTHQITQPWKKPTD